MAGFSIDDQPYKGLRFKGKELPLEKPVLKEGTKFDDGKLRYDLLPAGPLAALVSVYTYGAKKYADHNWRKGINFSRIFAACMRHLWAYWSGQDRDPESGLPHLAHAAFGIFSLLEYGESRPEFDDRYINENPNSLPLNSSSPLGGDPIPRIPCTPYLKWDANCSACNPPKDRTIQP